ncbi:hypothetical protein F5B22DRAFT_607877 [Xylaria bambusicola]|uniref:uncharacterized protein n=1 Tax=Xylaria bambusicola TaxID=326684 RepID=UPI00200882D7|nr:uncharacterized protein F5B22DRAFT_607877 [Xylaria bambusicola]KAI0515284.1 hypothetical protein F5B22DRAFT_607877 [Xylaria bambusicola]
MSSTTNGAGSTSTPDPSKQDAHHLPSAAATQAEMAQAFRDLARGEQQASILEANLASIESKLDALLASIETGADTGKIQGVEDKSSEEDQSSQKK